MSGSVNGITDYGFIRVSAGSQDAQTQERDILQASPGAVIVRTDTKAASASKGAQIDALDAVIAKLSAGDRVIVTDSSRLDRRDNLTSQVQTMLAIRSTGAAIVSLAPGEETFASGDDLGSWVTTLVKQNANAEKSRTVKTQTWRGIREVMANRGFYGPLPMMWVTTGERYSKRAVCTDPDAVKAIFETVADGTSMQSIAKRYGAWGTTIKKLLRFEGNRGQVTCRYTYNGGEEVTWTHETTAVVDAALWQRVQGVLEDNEDRESRKNRGGRPISMATNWVSGLLDCPVCGGALHINQGRNRNGTLRTPMLRCTGPRHGGACRKFPNQVAQTVESQIDALFSDDPTPLLRFDRIAGNAHEKAAIEAELDKLTASLGAIKDRAERRTVMATVEELEDAIEGFEIIPDRFDYTPAGMTVGDLWASAGIEEKRAMVRALKAAGGLALVPSADGSWVIDERLEGEEAASDIVHLGAGLCFRRNIPEGALQRYTTTQRYALGSEQ